MHCSLCAWLDVLPALSDRPVSYPESVEYLYALGNELKPGAKFGLERMQTLLRALGQPDANQRIVHVAGTNGKGSTCAMISQTLKEAGYKTGLNTSPHLVEPTERIQINGEPISRATFAVAFERVHAAAEEALARGEIETHPSYFETVTAMALCVFEDQRCDYTVLEVGLGGRLDATNVVQPRLTVITPVSFDHEAFLGNSLEAIAREKAGIIKPGIRVVVADQLAEAERVILKRTEEVGSRATLARSAHASRVGNFATGSRFELDGTVFECPLAGRHQVVNAVTAIVSCRELGIQDSTIARGLIKTRWPGRLETVREQPQFILDGAHNPAGARFLAEHIRDVYAGRTVWIVYGAMRDKAIDEVTTALFPLADKLIVTRPNMPRALQPETILSMYEHPNAVIAANVAEAIVLAASAPPDAVVFFTGSLYLVGEARGILVPLE